MIFSILLAVAISIVLLLAVAVLNPRCHFSVKFERIADEDATASIPDLLDNLRRQRDQFLGMVDRLNRDRNTLSGRVYDLTKERDLLAARLDDAEKACKSGGVIPFGRTLGEGP